MLDFTPVLKRLTQGQPAAELTTLAAQASGEEEHGGGQPSEAAPAASAHSDGLPAGQAQPVDARQLAERVYELMRNDLRVLNERRGLRE